MSDIEMDLTPPSPALSYKSMEASIFRPTTLMPPEPTTACEKRRQAMTRLKNQETMIEGYQKFLATFDKGKDQHGFYHQLQQNFKETIEARDALVSELSTMPPCVDKNCHGHSVLETKNKDLNETKNNKTKVNDKKPSKRRENIPRITRKTLSSGAKRPDKPPQRQYLNQSRFKIPS
ncbi:uncharacterized protein TNCV_4558641 [Trichonephila clavipes]|nr:uncharacterized protein TNCV_4558641 [Trichonephila clavipes]